MKPPQDHQQMITQAWLQLGGAIKVMNNFVFLWDFKLHE